MSLTEQTIVIRTYICDGCVAKGLLAPSVERIECAFDEPEETTWLRIEQYYGWRRDGERHLCAHCAMLASSASPKLHFQV